MLEWQKNISNKYYTLHEAMQYASEQGEGWRIPTKTELIRIVDWKRTYPACSVFPDTTTEYYWTNENLADGKYGVALYFGTGDCSLAYPSFKFRVRLVREL